MGNVILINPFEVPAGDDGDQFVSSWSGAADYMRRQPGFAGSSLHRALSPQARFGFINIAEWASPQDFQNAVSTPEFAGMARGGPPNYPSLYTVARTIEAP